MLPCTWARHMYIGVPGLGSAPGPPKIAPLEASGVNGDEACRQVMLWPSMPPFCACMDRLQQQSRKEGISSRARNISRIIDGFCQVCTREKAGNEPRRANSGSLTKAGCPISRSFFARCGLPPMLTGRCIGEIESQREGAVVSHISRKKSEIWGTQPSSGNQDIRILIRGELPASG